MYKCMYVYACMGMHAYMYVCAYMYTYMYLCVYVYVYIYIYGLDIDTVRDTKHSETSL